MLFITLELRRPPFQQVQECIICKLMFKFHEMVLSDHSLDSQERLTT